MDITSFSDRGQLLALEFGWGGGLSDDGAVPAKAEAEVAQNSWRGIPGTYSADMDPWQQFRWAVVWDAPHRSRPSIYPALWHPQQHAPTRLSCAPCRYDDEAVPTRDWLRRAYRAASAWLARGGGPSHRIGTLALWTLTSWDVVGRMLPAPGMHSAAASPANRARSPIAPSQHQGTCPCRGV